MSDLRKAAQELLDSWDLPFNFHPAAHRFEKLRAALAQPEQEPQWDEVFDAAVRAYARSAPSREALRLCFQNKSGSDQISIGWTAQELMAFAKDIASLYTHSPQRKPLTDEVIKQICTAGLETWRLGESTYQFARAIEKAHGIGGVNE